MAEPYGAVRHALCAGQFDVVLIRFVHHVTPEPHCVAGYGGQCQRNYRQNKTCPFRFLIQHAYAEQVGTIKLNEYEVNGIRHGLYKHYIGVAQLIGNAALAARHKHAQRHAQRQAYDH